MSKFINNISFQKLFQNVFIIHFIIISLIIYLYLQDDKSIYLPITRYQMLMIIILFWILLSLQV
jgi:hypothetical protein